MPPSQSDIDAFEANNPQAQSEKDAEVRVVGSDEPGNQVEEGGIAPNQEIGTHELTHGSRHELQLNSDNKDDTTVEGEQKGDEIQEPDKTEEQPSQEDTRQLFSEVGENSAMSKGLDTAFVPSMIDQLQVASEPAEASKEQSGNLAIASGQTIPQGWLIAHAQRKAAIKPPINLEDIFSRIGEIKYKGNKKPKTYSRITKDEQRNRMIHIATPPANKPTDQIALVDYNVATIPIGQATKEQEREEFKDSM